MRIEGLTWIVGPGSSSPFIHHHQFILREGYYHLPRSISQSASEAVDELLSQSSFIVER